MYELYSEQGKLIAVAENFDWYRYDKAIDRLKPSQFTNACYVIYKDVLYHITGRGFNELKIANCYIGVR